jgi:beta-glucanase (GH16 family)
MRMRTVFPICLAVLTLALVAMTVPRTAAEAAGTSSYNRLVFADSFNGKHVDTSKWTVTETSKHWVRHDNNCFQSDAVRIGGGVVTITSRYLTRQITCVLPTGYTFQTDKIAGSLHTKGKFEQTYGRWEVRAKFPAAMGYGHSAVWMYPKEKKYGEWPRSGEIDIVERFAAPWMANHAAQSLHYLDQSGGTSYNPNDGDGNPGESYMCDAGRMDQFNWYGMEWSPTQVTFTVNGRTCKTMAWNPSNVKAPAPFDQPFFTILQQQAGGDGNETGQIQSRTMVVDEVRVWGN